MAADGFSSIRLSLTTNFFLKFDDKLHFDEMYATRTVAAAPGPSAMGTASGAGQPRDKLEARFSWLLMSAGVQEATLDKFGTMGLTSLQMFRHIATDDNALRNLLRKKPFELDDTGGDALQALEVAKICSVYEASKESIAVENKYRAERLHQDLPPKLNPGEMDALQKTFESSHYKLNPIQKPSDAYFERKTHELEARFIAESLSRVTNSKQQDINDERNMSWDPVNGTFKEKGKVFRVPMPQKAEGLRARLRTMGVCWHFLKLKAPGRRELATAEVTVLDRYADWLCGPDVWGHSTDDMDGKPIATPAIDHVLILDLQVRKRVAELMNEGYDLRTTFDMATADTKIMQTHFFNHVAIDIGTAKCKACTAPGLAEAHAAVAGPPSQEAASGTKRAIGDSDTLSKNQLEKIKKKAKKEAFEAAKKNAQKLLSIQNGSPAATGVARPPGQGTSKAARARANKRAAAGGGAPPLAILNGGVGDGSAAKGKGKSKGKGNGACYAWNDGKPCKDTPCNFQHICSKCGGGHKRPDCTA